jgi:uncharacterized circularly permuted ATP-grasp superfamily protein/uncharacterized alpha-E superfamily protein
MSIDHRSADDYRAMAGQWDASRAPDGTTRSPWDQLEPVLRHVDLVERQQLAARLVASEGAAQLLHVDRGDPRTPPPLDPIPYCLDATSWQKLREGLEQRARLSDAIVRDLYGPRRLLQDGVVPAELVMGDPRYLRACRSIVARVPAVTLQTVDVVRDESGSFVVVGQHLDLAAGLGHAVFNRAITSRAMPEAAKAVAPLDQGDWWGRLRDALSALAPSDRDSPRVVVLVAGVDAVEYFEYAYLATTLGYNLVQGDDLVVRNGRLSLRSFGQLEPVDVVLRAIPSVACDALELSVEGLGGGVPGLAMTARAGGVGLANALGSAIGDHAGLTSYEAGMCEQLLGERLLIPTAPSYWLGDAEQCSHVLARLDRLDLYGVNDDGSVTITRGGSASDDALHELEQQVRQSPHRYSARASVASSTTPALIDRSVVPVEVVMRCAVLNTADGAAVLPGGVARGRNAPATKDVWIVDPELVGTARPRPPALPQVDLRGSLPARSAESLFWLGRHAERTEMIARTTNSIAMRVELDARTSAPEWLPRALRGLHEVCRSAGTVRADGSAPVDLWTVFRDGAASLGISLSGVVTSARAARAFLSQTAWRVVARVENARIALEGVAEQEHMFVLTESLDDLLLDLSALAGAGMESVVRGPGWMFWDIGRRIDRALLTLGLIEATLAAADEADVVPIAEVVLASCESLIAYRRRYRSDLRSEALVDLVVFDSSNPRSVAFQLDRLREHHSTLPQRDRDMGELLLQAAEALAEGVERNTPLDTLVVATRGPLLDYVECFGATWFSHVDVPGALGVRS